MQRAIGCSLDWPTGTLYKETVLRVPTELASRMATLPRVKLGVKRERLEIMKNPKYKLRQAAPKNADRTVNSSRIPPANPDLASISSRGPRHHSNLNRVSLASPSGNISSNDTSRREIPINTDNMV